MSMSMRAARDARGVQVELMHARRAAPAVRGRAARAGAPARLARLARLGARRVSARCEADGAGRAPGAGKGRAPPGGGKDASDDTPAWPWARGGKPEEEAGNELEPSDWLSSTEVRDLRGGLPPPPPPPPTPTAQNPEVENREVLYFGALIIAVPLVFSTLMRETVFHPVLERRLAVDDTSFALNTEQKREVVDELLQEEKGRQFDVIAGRAPALPESPDRLREELLELEKHEREINLRSVENLVSDSTWLFSSSLLLALNKSGVKRLTSNIQSTFYGLTPATQAFSLLLVSDITVGFHSSDGWITIVNGLCGHYGWEESETFVSLFVATVPVSIDVIFKYWVFKYLRNMSPTTGIILEDIDR